ncbi:MAG: GyrI-like domain-containing protein [Oscillospiraceae bacterium]|nr:GyrI-like domain-containing protein [Oscillospiraceae bacterium]
MESKNIMGFPYEERTLEAFNIIGFTKIVPSGGELYDEVRTDGRWQTLQSMNAADKNIYGAASHDRKCSEGHYRYTLGVRHDKSYTANPLHDALFELRVKKSDWIVFTLNFEQEYGAFWGKNPYAMIKELGYDFNKGVGLHIDVFSESYNGHEMEFWMPVCKK